MSSLWTPSGEHFPEKEEAAAPGRPAPQPGDTDVTEPSPEEAQAAVDAMRAQLADTPAEVVIANHCYGLFELSAIYLSQTPPMLFQARLAIDALGYLLEGLKGRLGEAEPALLESLSQLRLVYVGLEGAEQTDAESSANAANGGPA
jgi:methionine synthase II (cobalamin-independent)